MEYDEAAFELITSCGDGEEIVWAWVRRWLLWVDGMRSGWAVCAAVCLDRSEWGVVRSI